jgi:hypothetical protein
MKPTGADAKHQRNHGELPPSLLPLILLLILILILLARGVQLCSVLCSESAAT